MPNTVGTCLGQNAESTFEKEIPNNCVADLNKAAKIGLKLENEKDNQLLFAKGKPFIHSDLVLLQRLYQNKVRK